MKCQRCGVPINNFPESKGFCRHCDAAVTQYWLQQIPNMTKEELKELQDMVDEIILERINSGSIVLH